MTTIYSPIGGRNGTLPPLIDAAGREHTPAGSRARIVSLVPSLTELLFDLRLGWQVVGRTAFCVHPRALVKAVRSIGGTKTVNMQKLRRLAPTHVIVNIDETPRPLADALAAEGYVVVVTHPVDVRDNVVLYRLLGRLFGRDAEAEALCRHFEAAYAAAVHAACSLPKRRVLYLIWKDPWMTVARDTYISRMLALVGLLTLPEDPPHRYPVIWLDEDLLAAVDLVLFSSEPFPFKVEHLAAFRAGHPQHAVKAAAIDAQMVSWYGSRAIAGLGDLVRFARSHA